MYTTKKLKSTIDSLPKELLSEILKLIPMIILLEFRTVCKAWNSIICEANFVRFHDQELQSNVARDLIVSYEHGDLTISNILHRTRNTYMRILKRFSTENLVDGKTTTRTTQIVGYVDGVFLIHMSPHYINNGTNVILLWNPKIEKLVEVPPYKSFKESGNVNFGFGFDNLSGVYKVVAVKNLKCYNLETMVYSLGSHSWGPPKEKKCSINTDIYLQKYSRTFNFENRVYWLGSLERKAKNLTHYICFDLSSEAFTCLELPDTGGLEMRQRRFFILRDSIALVDYSKSGQLRAWSRSKSLSNDNYSWVVLFDVDIFNGKSMSLLYMNDINVYLFNSCSRWNTICAFNIDMETHKLTKGCYTTGVTRKDTFMDNFIESFALLGQPSCKRKLVVNELIYDYATRSKTTTKQ